MRDSTLISEQIEEKKAYLNALKTQRLNLVSGGVSEYSIQNGDDRRSATCIPLTSLSAEIRKTENEIEILTKRLAGNGSGMGVIVGART